MLRRLRIAVSILCLATCVLMIALWARSHYREDCLCWGLTPKSGFMVFSLRGMLLVNRINDFGGGERKVQLSKWFVDSYPPGNAFWLPYHVADAATLGFLFRSYPNGSFFVAVPYWFMLIMSSCIAAMLHFKRFSLRTILIAMTLVAIFLGILAISTKDIIRPPVPLDLHTY